MNQKGWIVKLTTAWRPKSSWPKLPIKSLRRFVQSFGMWRGTNWRRKGTFALSLRPAACAANKDKSSREKLYFKTFLSWNNSVVDKVYLIGVIHSLSSYLLGQIWTYGIWLQHIGKKCSNIFQPFKLFSVNFPSPCYKNKTIKLAVHPTKKSCEKEFCISFLICR